MLTGEFPISAGTAYLDGYNIQTQLRQVSDKAPDSQNLVYLSLNDNQTFSISRCNNVLVIVLRWVCWVNFIKYEKSSTFVEGIKRLF